MKYYEILFENLYIFYKVILKKKSSFVNYTIVNLEMLSDVHLILDIYSTFLSIFF